MEQHTTEQVKVNFDASANAAAGADSFQPKQWHDANPKNFTKDDRIHTTLLFGGLTILQDKFLEAGLEAGGCRIQALDCPDNAAFQLGKEYGNRGQCNPTYFTVGNLVKYLKFLNEEQGMSKEDITEKYLFLTAGTCGPCRFGMYATEYRKALRDAGFDNFRVITFEAGEGMHQVNGEEAGLNVDVPFIMSALRCLIAGDVLNLMGYRIRPYEVVEGSADKALAQCREIVINALRNKKSILLAMYKCRKILKAVKVNRLQVKPKVAVIGEFWAMTTEGDGNYHLQRYLESEGAEVEIQPVLNMLMYLYWEVKFDARRALEMPDKNTVKEGWDFKPVKKLFYLWLGEKFIRTWFGVYGKIAGLKNYKLSNVDELEKIAHKYHSNEMHGGEGPMEVGKLIKYVTKKQAHLVISVKPFGCMPSSAVSDGVQSLVTADYPDANFLPIETSGDGAVNVYSRVQMALYRARKQAQEEFGAALEHKGVDEESITETIHRKWENALRTPRHKEACSAANLVYEL